MTGRPALIGGDPVFSPAIPFARPTVEDPEGIIESVRGSLLSGQLTDGPLVRALEERTAATLEVGHCVAVSSCTVGLMLVIQALAPDGPVLVPSFTFSATAHAVRWNGVPISFADCDRDTWCLGPDQVRGEPDLIIGVHVSGVPCDVDGLEKVAQSLGAELVYDAAHGSGSLVESGGRVRPLGGFGRAEVFSLTPTKVLSGVEGGLVTTDDEGLADHLRMARNYGNPGDYDTRFPGLNARLSELHAAVALASLDHLEQRVSRRNELAELFRLRLGAFPGIGFQGVPAGARSSMKDFTILVDGERFGCRAERVTEALREEGIPTRRYYSPPVHRQTAYRDVTTPALPVTDRLASQVVSLPIWSHMEQSVADGICRAIEKIHAHAEEIDSTTVAG